jgi:hypothetical protein
MWMSFEAFTTIPSRSKREGIFDIIAALLIINFDPGMDNFLHHYMESHLY